MLPPQMRSEIVEVLVNKEAGNSSYGYQQHGNLLRDIMRNGFKGYAAFTDKQLVQALQLFASQGDNNCNTCLTKIANFVILGDPE